MFEMAVSQSLHPLFHWMIKQVLEVLSLDHDLVIYPLTEWLNCSSFSMSLIGVDPIDLVTIYKVLI